MKLQAMLLQLTLALAVALVNCSRANNAIVNLKPPFSDSVEFGVTGPRSMIKPCCVSWGPGRVDCFIRDKASNVMHWWKQDGLAYGWERLDGVHINNVECVSRQKGSIGIFAVANDGNVNINSVDGFTGMWTGWKSVSGGRLMDAPSCTVRSPTEMDCIGVGIGTANAYTIKYKDGTWGKWTKRNLSTRYRCKSSRRTDSITDLWCVGDYGALMISNIVGSRWNAWSNLGGKLVGQPEVKSMKKDRIDVLAVGQRNQLLHRAFDGTWHKWMNLGGSIVDAPSCVIVGSSLHCFMVRVNSYLYRRSLEGGKWSGWVALGGQFIEGPSCVLSDVGKKEVSCYLRDSDKRIQERVFRF